jgi:glucosamine--fructose-6-phosphate aminotransferase (isomerizing)
MKTMLAEIKSMPERAQYFLRNSKEYTLPLGVPYIGMGSSYFAPLAFKYMGLDVRTELASEFYNYQYRGPKIPTGVLLSQSGRSTEVLWCVPLFDSYTAISNNPDSPLCNFPNAGNIIPLLAGEEKYSSSKTYINTLLALFRGFGFDVQSAVRLMGDKMPEYEQQGKALAEAVFEWIDHHKFTGLYITGSGPNMATAMQAALIMSESTKLNFNGLPMAQYDHGPKETARDSVVIQILSKGKSYERCKKLSETIQRAGALVLTVEEPAASENESILTNIIPFNFMAYYLSLKLNVQETFLVGGKVTEVK